MTSDEILISKIYLDATTIYNKILNSQAGLKGLQYLKHRYISKEIANQFKIGFAPQNKERQYLFHELIGSFKYSPEDALKSKLFKINLKYGLMQDTIGSQRIVLPIIYNDRVMTLSTRTLFETVSPRYKTITANKLGIFNADILINNNEDIYICEGVVDAISLIVMGYKAVGIIGLSVFGKEHCSLFNTCEGRIIFMFDSDSNGSGKKGMRRISNMLFEAGHKSLFYKKLPLADGIKKIDINGLLVSKGIRKCMELLDSLGVLELEYEPYKAIKYHSGSCQVNLITILINDGINVKQTGHNRYKCLCPLHHDTEPSFVIYVDSDGQRFKCFGCGESGNAIDYLMKNKHLTYNEAINLAR
jgi:DNA primase